MTNPHRARPSGSRPVRILWTGLGGLFVAVGAVGVIIPGLPTTPFLILAAACFLRSSQKLYDRVLSHRVFGPLVRDFREGRGIPRAAKWSAIALMAIFVSFALLVGVPAEWVIAKVVVGVAGLIGVIYLLCLPSSN